jgi:iduronate 2-sulfatase
VPVLRDPEARVRDHTFHCFPKAKLGRAIRTERYRLVEWKEKEKPDASPVWELYDLAEDPNETRNLARERTGVVAELRERLP